MPSTNDSRASLNVVDRSGEGALLLVPTTSLGDNVWYRIQEICGNKTIQGEPGRREIIIPWSHAFSLLPQIAKLKPLFHFEIELDEVCQARFRQFQEERRAVATARQETRTQNVDEEQIRAQLVAVGFSRRDLKPFQKQDTARLVALPNGANFSVPGAGKTSVALAVSVLTKRPETILLVVAPKNAFGAWEEAIEQCFREDAPHYNAEAFIRLYGDENNLTEQLYSGHHRFLVSYERFARYVEVFTGFLCRRDVHLILDESHRVKAGMMSQRGQAILSVAGLPTRRDILSGTPLPHDVSDLTAQMDFLWPGQRMGSLLSGGQSPKKALRNLYVRTTKSQLGLLPPIRKFVPIRMAPYHAAFYVVLSN